MRFLPIIERELRVAGRKPRTYWGRVAAVATLALIVFWVLMGMVGSNPGTIGRTLFGVLGGLSAFLCGLGGLRLTADCLSVEKREGTLGLLFLTNLRSADIVLGKLGAAGIQALLNLLAVFPLFALPFLLGGVTLREYLLLLGALLNLLLLSLSLGLLSSVILRDDRSALGFAMLLVLMALGVPPAVGGALFYHDLINEKILGFFMSLSAGAGSVIALSGQSVQPTMLLAYQVSAVVSLIVSLSALGFAAFLLPGVFRREGASDGGAKKRTSAARADGIEPGSGDVPRLTTPRRELLEINPVLWLCLRGRMQRIGPWLGLLVTGALWVTGLMIWKNDWLNAAVYFMTAFCLHTQLKLQVAGVACRQFCQDRASGALELLLCSGLGVRDVLRGQSMAVFRAFRGPVVAVLVADMLLFVAFMGEVGRGDVGTSTFVWAAAVVVLLADLVTLTPLSMWLGLTHRRTNAAVTKAVVRVMVLPWAVFLMAVSLVAVLPFQMRADLSGMGMTLFWLMLSLVNAVVWFAHATTSLRRRFRTEAAGQFGAKEGFWKSLLRPLRRTPPPLPVAARRG